ncbi:MAG: RidA family protein [Nitrospinota bacterium]
MAKRVERLHWKGADTTQWMPYAPVIRVDRGKIVFIAGCTSAPMYHSHPHVPEEFDNMPTGLGEQTRVALEGMKKSLEAVGATFDDVVECTRFVTDLSEQDAMNKAWAEYFTGDKPTTVTVQVVQLATDPRCKVEISAIAVVDDEA